MKTTLTAIVITKNEEERIGACLQSLAWANEIIVVDNGSTDKTLDIVKRHDLITLEAKGKDFSSIREMGLQQASSDWVLYIDADEKVSTALAKEIEHVVSSYKPADYIGYFITRDTYYLGYHWPYQDKVERLFLKSALHGWHGSLHETPIYMGDVGKLQHPLVHMTHRTLEEMLTKTNEWSKTEALLRYQIHHPPVVWWRLIRVMVTGFMRSFFIQGGWKAGVVGWIESIYQAFSMFITYAKLWELQQKNVSTKNEDLI